MDILIVVLAVILGAFGLLGCLIPVIPGPPLSYIGLLVLYLWHDKLPAFYGDITFAPTGKFMLVWLGITVTVTIIDYIIPVFFTKLTGGSKEAMRCSIAGTIIGMVFFPPFGIILGAFLGAFLGEMIMNNKKLGASLLSGLGAFMGFILGTGIKLATSGMMMYYIIKFI